MKTITCSAFGLARRRALRARRGILPCYGLRGVLRTLKLEIAKHAERNMNVFMIVCVSTNQTMLPRSPRDLKRITGESKHQTDSKETQK